MAKGLLLLCMVASEVWNAETRPIDFVCDRESRRDMNTVAEMEAALADCDALKTLPSPIQLPCIKVHKASWERKSAQEKKGDIAASLRALSRSVRVVKTLSQPGCAATLLERLEHTVNNYLHIITHLDVRVRDNNKYTHYSLLHSLRGRGAECAAAPPEKSEFKKYIYHQMCKSSALGLSISRPI
uniref:Thrombopoietin n=1 Tax=Salmo trutta TaxID=8032 RepID=A0A674CWN3_SALTR